MCVFCLLYFMGEMAVQGAAGACGARQGEYRIAESEVVKKEKRKKHDWRYYLCCLSKSGTQAARGKMVFLHGVLYLEIHGATGLEDVDTSWFRSEKDVSDPYVTVDTCAGGKKTCRICKTSIIYNSLSPQWAEKFRIELCHEAESLLFSVKDMDLINVESMGYTSITTEELLSEEPIRSSYQLISKDGMPAGMLDLSVHYKSVTSITRSNEVPDTVYPLRSGCNVTLYQDAHTPAVSPITDVADYVPTNLWIDVGKHIEAAQKIIYILGWSVKADLDLERDNLGETLGEILKRKADEGVRVLIMVWNEALSTDVYPPGVMGTHDEETRMFFDGSEVEVVLAPRNKNKGKLFETGFVSTCYTHHQKCVIVDAEIEGSDKRRLVSFVGGIDLTDGRWDVPEHPLYRTLPNEHNKDFYNGCCASSSTVGPRQPWHDIHAKVDGPAVKDILSNFVERWRKQAPDRENRLLPLPPDEFDFEEEPTEDREWSVQFFRSINSDSALFETSNLNKLMSRKGRLYENSIQRAYIHHIRRTKKFIYFENQYFLGSSHGWFVQEAKCPHLIPVEITTKIVNSIKAGDPVRAYILIPLHPEGDPSSAAVQEILHWQYRTIEMMYRKIAKTLKKRNIPDHPTDYLSFFFVGKREGPEDVPDGLDEPDSDSVAAKVREHLRFMIYVHSKMAIFDDEYIIIGSANINERSMSGNRDTEMAIGAFQNEYTKEKMDGEPIQGEVHKFRLALWAEHCGEHFSSHLDPSSIECMALMRKIGEDNLIQFLSTEPEHRESHLMIYPIDVAQDGKVTAREDCENFPDTNARVLGKASTFLPNSLTT